MNEMDNFQEGRSYQTSNEKIQGALRCITAEDTGEELIERKQLLFKRGRGGSESGLATDLFLKGVALIKVTQSFILKAIL